MIRDAEKHASTDFADRPQGEMLRTLGQIPLGGSRRGQSQAEDINCQSKAVDSLDVLKRVPKREHNSKV